jgi:Reverse transcriptase (RNA-dependent DNA polymerase)
VFKRKLDKEGKVSRYKARLVAMGFSQRKGFDYEETYAPVVRFKSIRTFLAMTAEWGMTVHQMDVKTAFLNGTLTNVEIYMEQPEGYQVDEKDKCCLLKKSLYGLKQSPREWNSVLNTYLIGRGFTRCNEEMCMYTKADKMGKIVLILGVFVDDIFIGCLKNYMDLLKSEKAALCRRFEMDDQGELDWLLGIQVKNDSKNGVVSMNQHRYIEKILRNFNMEECTPVSTPVEVNNQLTKIGEDEERFNGPYLEAIGSLMYLMLGTRPDLGYAVGLLSRFSASPSKKHWEAVLRVFKYLKGSKELELVYKRGDTSQLVGYSDADYAGDLSDRKSTSGYLTMFIGGAIQWSSKKQKTVALSTMEAEYIALSECIREVQYERKLLEELGKTQGCTTPVKCDNQSTIITATQDGNVHDRSKHFDIKYHYVREKVKEEIVKISYIRSEDNVSDILTKALPRERFAKLRELMGLKLINSSGSVRICESNVSGDTGGFVETPQYTHMSRSDDETTKDPWKHKGHSKRNRNRIRG